MVAAQPAPRFYVDASSALHQYNCYKRGCSRIHGVERRKMYAEIFSRFERKMKLLVATGQVASKKTVMESILEQEAPSFYYDGDSAAKIYYKEMLKQRRYKRI